jgi:hypothetical protein
MNDATGQLTQQLLQALLLPERKEPKPRDDSLLNSMLGAILGRSLGGGRGVPTPSNTQGVLGPLGGPLAESGVSGVGEILKGTGINFVPGANVIHALATQRNWGTPPWKLPAFIEWQKAKPAGMSWTDYQRTNPPPKAI